MVIARSAALGMVIVQNKKWVFYSLGVLKKNNQYDGHQNQS